MLVACIETCPCWEFQNIINKWESTHNSNKENKESEK